MNCVLLVFLVVSLSWAADAMPTKEQYQGKLSKRSLSEKNGFPLINSEEENLTNKPEKESDVTYHRSLQEGKGSKSQEVINQPDQQEFVPTTQLPAYRPVSPTWPTVTPSPCP